MTLVLTTCAAACGSTSVENVPGPGGIRCAASLNAQPATVPPEGANVTVTVSAARDCTWSARTDVSWMQVRSASGQGNGTFAATVARNDVISARSGGIIVNDQRLGITQEGRGCSYDLTGSSEPVGANGGRRSLSVSTLAGCSWAATTSAVWIVVSNPSGSGPATIAFDVLTNPGAAREASITVGGKSFVVSQIAAPTAPACTFTIAPQALDFAVPGGQGEVTVTTQATCTWTIEGGAAWTTPLSGGGTGNGTARYAVGPNLSITPRTTSLTIAGRVHTITQQGVLCTFTLTPPSRSFGAGGGAGAVQVDTLPGCAWTAASNAGWMAVGTISGNGPGGVPYTVQANADPGARSALIVIGGQTHTVTQEGAAPVCTYALDPAARTFTAAQGTAAVRINTQAGCAWTADSTVAWIVPAQQSGIGPADLSYTVAANTASEGRAGALNIGGQSHAVTQEGAAPPCAYTLAPAERLFASAGGPGTVRVTTGVACAWTAVSSEPWVTIATGSASGAGTADIGYTVAAAPAGTNRTATVTVNGQVHTIRQGP